MLAPLLAAATAAAAPAITPPALIYDPGARFMEMRTNGSRASGDVLYALTVDPAGRVVACRVVDSSGSPKLDGLSCMNAQRNFRFRPARGADGQPTFGVVRQVVVWSEGFVSSGPRAPGADVVLKVGRMPADWAKAPSVRVDFVVGAQGGLASCARAADPLVPAAGAGSERAKQEERMARAACAALPNAFKIESAHDLSGKAVPSVQSASVMFEDGTQSAAAG